MELENYDLAKWLSEKGFNEPCLMWFAENKTKQTDIDAYVNWCNLQAYKFTELTNKNIHVALNKDCYAIPTIEQVIDWVFDRFNYSIEAHLNIPEEGEQDGCYVFNGIIKSSDNYKLITNYQSKNYPTRKEALIDAILHFKSL